MKLIKDLGMLYPTEKSKHKSRYGLYECSLCKKHFKVLVSEVKKGQTKCRNCANKINATKHGEVKTRLYKCWIDMIQRVSNKNNKRFIHYGARGITVCDEWLKYENFRKWALGNGYEEHLTIDRKNNDSNYEPSNCRWTNRTAQARNTQKLRSGNTSGYRGVSYHINFKKWAARIGVNKKLIHIGYFENPIDAAYAYDNYILSNNLEHTKNF